MKTFASPLRAPLAVLLLLALAAASPAQDCSYTVSASTYGPPCAPVAGNPPTLAASFDGSGGCMLKLDYVVPPTCCNVLLAQQWLLVGTAPAAITLGGGCTVLVAPAWLVALTPTIGTTQLSAVLPDNPVLIGQSLYLQGVVDRFTTIGFTHELEFSAGLQLLFL